MGQRSQTFIKIKNPLKNKEYLEEMKTHDEKQIFAARRLYGNKEFSIIPFHHQNLWGLTFTGMAYNILMKTNAKGEYNPFSQDFNNVDYGNFSNHHTFKAYLAYGLIDTMTAMISIQDNDDIAEMTGRFGKENFTYIGDECYNESGLKNYDDIRDNFTIGDNNNGILIIDAVERKYCFMNIFEQDVDYDGIYRLPNMKPVSATEHVKAYYPIRADELTEYQIVQAKKQGKELKDVAIEHQKEVNKIEKMFRYFGVLSEDEVKTMFPKMYKTVKK